MKFTLLTHEREFGKQTNTGRLVVNVLGGNAEQILWERTNPVARLVEDIENGSIALLYPGTGDETLSDIDDIDRFIIIDGTWQEARKIYNRSPYLQRAKRFSLRIKGKSGYSLRKNQKEYGLCTAECVMEILRIKGQAPVADTLKEHFKEFVENRGAGKLTA